MAALLCSSCFPPASSEQAVEQARLSLFQVLESPLKRRLEPATIRKSSRRQQQSRFTIEIPLSDASEETLVSMSLGLLHASPASKLCLVLPNPSIEDLVSASQDGSRAPELQLANLEQGGEFLIHRDSAFILVVAPEMSDLEKVRRLSSKSGNRPLVVLNPEWSEQDERESLSGLFQVAYSFTPLSIQAFLSRTEGAVLKQFPLDSPWRVFVKEDGEFRCILSLNRRPSPQDLETALYNRTAANSPLVKSMKFVKGLLKR